MDRLKEETMGVVANPQVLAYLSLELLSGATNVGGITATTQKFINKSYNTRPQVG